MPVNYPQLDEPALAILRQAIAEAGTIAAVARRLGYKRPGLSMALAGKYPADTKVLRAQIVETFGGRLLCPHLRADIPASECRFFRSRPLPTSRHAEVEHWLACKSCPLNPDRKDVA